MKSNDRNDGDGKVMKCGEASGFFRAAGSAVEKARIIVPLTDGALQAQLDSIKEPDELSAREKEDAFSRAVALEDERQTRKANANLVRSLILICGIGLSLCGMLKGDFTDVMEIIGKLNGPVIKS